MKMLFRHTFWAKKTKQTWEVEISLQGLLDLGFAANIKKFTSQEKKISKVIFMCKVQLTVID